MTQNLFCGPACDIGAFDSSDPTCNMPFIPRVLREIMDNCDVPKAPPAIWEVVMPDFPLLPNILFDCRLPKVESIGGVSVTVVADTEFGACVPNFLFEWADVDLECPTITLSDTLNLPDPENGDEVGEAPLNDDPFPVDESCDDQINFVQSYRVTKEPELLQSVATFKKPVQGECAYEMNFGFVMPCITCTDINLGTKEDENDGVLVTVIPELEAPDVRVIWDKPKRTDESELAGECILDEDESCDYELSFEFDLQLILCNDLAVTTDTAGVVVDVTPGPNLTPDACSYAINFNFDDFEFCPIMRAGDAVIPAPIDCSLAPEPTPLPPVPSEIQVLEAIDYWWCFVQQAQFDQDATALDTALTDYETNIPEHFWRVKPEYNTHLRTSTSFDREQISTVTEVPGLITPRIFMRTEKAVAEDCEFKFGIDLELPELCGELVAGTDDFGTLGPRPPYPGLPPANSTKTVRTAHAEYWWWEVRKFQILKDVANVQVMLERYIDEVPGVDVYLVPEYSPFVSLSTSYDKQPKSKVEYVEDLDEPHLFLRTEKQDEEQCILDVSLDLQLPAIICNLLSPTGTDAPDPGDRPADPGILPAEPSPEQKQQRADYWWWPIQKNQFDKNENDIETNFFVFEAFVPEEERGLANGYNANLLESTQPLEEQDSTIELLPPGAEPSIFVRVEQEDPAEGEENDPCRFRFGIDIKIPTPDLSDIDLDATPFLGYRQDPDSGDEIETNGEGCVTINLKEGRSQTFTVPGSDLYVRAGKQLVVTARIKPGSFPDPVNGYVVGDIEIEYNVEDTEFLAPFKKPDKVTPEPAGPQLAPPVGAGAVREVKAIVGFMSNDGTEDKWTQLLNECLIIEAIELPDVPFRSYVINDNPGNPAPPAAKLAPALQTVDGAIMFTFNDGQTKGHLFNVANAGVDILPGKSLVLKIADIDDAYTATADNTKPGGVRYDFTPATLTMSLEVVNLIDLDAPVGGFIEMLDIDIACVIGTYYNAPNTHYAGPGQVWIQKHEGIWHMPLPKPGGILPPAQAPGTVLTSAGVGKQPYFDYPRYL